MTIEVRRYRPADHEPLFAFLAKRFPDRDWKREPQIWHWRYEQNPFEREGPCILLAVRDGEIVGHIATMQVPVAVDREIFRGRWAVDLIVDESTRGTGLGKRMIQAWIDESEVCLGKGVSESADRIYRKMNWQHVELLPVRVLPVSGRAVLGRRAVDPRLAWVADRTTRWLGSLWLRAYQRSTSLEFRIAERAPAALDELAAKLVTKNRITLVRGRDYVQWRYLDCPTTSYRLLTASRDGDLVGFATISVTPSRGFMRGVVHDLQLADHDERDFTQFFVRAARELHRMGADEVTILPRTPREDAIVRRMGAVGRTSPIMILYNNSKRPLDLAGASQSLNVQIGDSDGW